MLGLKCVNLNFQSFVVAAGGLAEGDEYFLALQCQVVTREDLGWGGAWSGGDVLGRQQSIGVSDAYSCEPLPCGC